MKERAFAAAPTVLVDGLREQVAMSGLAETAAAKPLMGISGRIARGRPHTCELPQT